MPYKAFISYSHSADGRLAPAVQAGLHRFAKPWYRMRALRVFRDKTSLSASPELWPSIERALSESEFFLLFASPASAGSKWVRQELEWWLRNRPADRLLILLTSGELFWDPATGALDSDRTTALAPALAAELRQEPLFVDLRWAQSEERLTLRDARFRSVILDVAAPLHGRAKDELDGEDIRQHRRTRIVAALAVFTIVLGFVTAVWQAIEARRAQGQAETQRDLAQKRQVEAETERAEAVRQRDQALGRALYAESSRLSAAARTRELSLLLAVEALRRTPEPALIGHVYDLFRQTAEVTAQIRFPEEGVSGGAFSPDGSRVAFLTGYEYLRVYETRGGREIGRARLGPLQPPRSTPSSEQLAANLGSPLFIGFSRDGEQIAVFSRNHAWVYGVKQARLSAQTKFRPGTFRDPEYRFSSSGRLFARANGGHIEIVESRSLALVSELEIADGSGDQAAVSDDGRWVAYACSSDSLCDKAGSLLDVASRRTMKIALPYRPAAMAFSPDGRYVAFDGEKDDLDGKTQFAKLPAVFTTSGEPAPDRMAAESLGWFGPERTYSLERDSTISERGNSMYPARFRIPDGRSAAWAEDSESLLTSDGAIRETRSGKQLAGLVRDVRLGLTGASVIVSKAGEFAAFYDDDGATIARGYRGRLLMSLPVLPHRVVTGRSGLVAVGDSRSTISIVRSGRIVTQVPACGGPIKGDADFSRFVLGCDDDSVRLVDPAGNISSWRHSKMELFAVDPQVHLLLTARDHTKHDRDLVDTRTRRIVRRLQDLAFFDGEIGPDGQYFVGYGGAFSGLVIRPLNGAGPSSVLDVEVESVAFSPDGKMVAAGSQERAAVVYSVPSGRLIARFDHKSEEQTALGISVVRFSDDGTKLVTLSHPRGTGAETAYTLNVFDVPAPRHLLQVSLPEEPRGIWFTAGGDAVEVAFGSRRLRIERFPIAPSEWMAEICGRVTRNLTADEWNRYLPGFPYASSCPSLNPNTPPPPRHK